MQADRRRIGEADRANSPLRLFHHGKKDGATYPLRPEDIYYFESIDDKTFAYCEKDVYECSLRLYELEQQFARADFVRISKSCILNIMKLSSRLDRIFPHHVFAQPKRLLGGQHGDRNAERLPDRHLRTRWAACRKRCNGSSRHFPYRTPACSFAA